MRHRWEEILVSPGKPPVQACRNCGQRRALFQYTVDWGRYAGQRKAGWFLADKDGGPAWGLHHQPIKPEPCDSVQAMCAMPALMEAMRRKP